MNPDGRGEEEESGGTGKKGEKNHNWDVFY